jgi:hypothetical protein
MMEAVSTSKMSLNFYQTTRRNIPEDSHLHTRRRENLKLLMFSKTACYASNSWYVTFTTRLTEIYNFCLKHFSAR